jgi:hypothetical protein
MLQLHLINLVYLIILLAPGVVAGSVVSWNTRSNWAIFTTTCASLFASFVIAIVTILFGKLLSPLLVGWLGHGWVSLIDFSQAPEPDEFLGFVPYYIISYYRYSIIAPIGTVAGAALVGMLLVVKHELQRSNTKLDPSSAWVACLSSTVMGGSMSLASILTLSWLGWKGLELAINHFGGEFLFTEWGFYGTYALWGLLILVNSLICGLTSAFFGMKAARILT